MALWKEIIGYEGLYLISDEGNIVALPKLVKGRNLAGDIEVHRKAKMLKKFLRGKNGLMYEGVALSRDGETKRYAVHRLVAEAFIPNPDNLPEINHKDENPLNNQVDNLEWCTHQYNIDYSKSKPVVQIKDGEAIGKYKSIKEASRSTGIGRTNITNVLCGWSNTAGGFQWAYGE